MVEHHTNNSCYIFGFSVTSFFQLHSQKRVNEVLIKIQQHIELPPGTLILNVDGDHYRFGRKFYWMRGARVI